MRNITYIFSFTFEFLALSSHPNLWRISMNAYLYLQIVPFLLIYSHFFSVGVGGGGEPEVLFTDRL